MWGREFFQHWIPPKSRSGVILLGINLVSFNIDNITHGEFHVKFHLKSKEDGFRWVIMAVYGAAQTEHKDHFLAELVNSCRAETLQLMVGGDFNIFKKPIGEK